MMASKSFISIAKIALVLVYLVIIAGATVRMTGSGMGCPDWPKCFGYYIPPTDEEQLLWKPEHEYRKGQIIILNQKLWVAQKNFISEKQYDRNDWVEYTKHDYALFNPYHTWIEYINRLFGALAGLACVTLFFRSFIYGKTNRKIVLWAGISLFLLLFNAWLGATVVFSVLNPVKITIHMLAALLTVATLTYVLHLTKGNLGLVKVDKGFRNLLWLSFLLTITQVIFGTQVRQAIDSLTRADITDRSLWLHNPDFWFYVHRSLSFGVFAANSYLWYKSYRTKWFTGNVNLIMAIVLAEIATGIAMAYFHFPFSSQALHLVLASLMFGAQINVILKTINPVKHYPKLLFKQPLI